MACQLEELKKCSKRIKALKDTLNSLPLTLEETYDQIISRIPQADVSDALKLLLWLAFAKEPLVIHELALVVEYDADQDLFDPEAKLSSPEEVLKICSSLVTKMYNNTVQLAHASVKEYILKRSRKLGMIDYSSGNFFVGQCCLSYILQSKERIRVPDYFDLEYTKFGTSLIRYSAKYWPLHILESQNELNALKNIRKLFQPDSIPLKNWVDGYNYGIWKGEEMMDTSGLQCAAFNGLSETVKWLMSSATVTDMDCFKALCAASYKGHMNIAGFLLQNCTNINLKPQQGQYIYCSILQAASSGGHKDITELLLEGGADVNAQGGEHGNSLLAASLNGHKDTVELLLERGANANAQGGNFGNALQAASFRGHKDIVELLLNHGGNVKNLHAVQFKWCDWEDGNNFDVEFSSALQAASFSGHTNIVKLLLERGAEGGQPSQALQTASKRGHIKVVELLLNYGVKQE